MKRLLALLAVAVLLVAMFPAAALADGPGTPDYIVSKWTPSASGVGANTMAFEFPSYADALDAVEDLKYNNYVEDASGQGETTTQAPNTYSLFDLAAFGWGTATTVYVYIEGAGGASAPAAAAPIAAAAPGVPAELASAFVVGVWPLAAGSYDPALDGQGIPNGASVYGLFDAAYAVLPNPTGVTGYTEVSDLGSLGASNYYLLIGSSGFNYVIVGADGMSAGGGAAAAPEVISAPAPADAPSGGSGLYTMSGADTQEKLDSLIAQFTPSTSGVAGDTKAFEFPSMNDARNAAAYLVELGFNETSEGIQEFTDVAPYTYGFFDLAAFGWGTATTLYINCLAGDPPAPKNFTFDIQDKPGLKITLNDAYEKFGYFLLQPAENQQKAYLFRIKENGSLSFSQDVTLWKVDIQSGAKTESINIKADTATPITQLHDTRLYLGNDDDSNYVQFLNDKESTFYIPALFFDMTDSNTGISYKNKCLNVIEGNRLAPYSLFSGTNGESLLQIVIIGLAVAVPMLIIVWFAHTRETKTGGVKFAQATFNID